MKSTKLTVFLLLICGPLLAQDATSASGGEASGTGGTVSYTIGQIDYTTNSGSNGSASLGVQQAYEIYSVGVSEVLPDIHFRVYPNPTTDQLTIELDKMIYPNMKYEVFDSNGKLIQKNTIPTTQTQINANNWPPATYHLFILTENRKIQSFKIIKNQ